MPATPLRPSHHRARPKADSRLAGSIKILHLSDMHFDRHTTFDPKQPDAADEYLRQLRAEVNARHTSDDPFDLVVVTGDLVDFDQWRRKKYLAALDRARDYLLALCSDLGIPHTEGLLVIPGNHDYLLRGISYRSGAPEWFDSRFGLYNKHRWYPEMNLLVGCFDSNVDPSSLRIATGYVDRGQFDALRNEVQRLGLAARAGSAFHLALVHHHVLPIATAENLVPTSWYERWVGRRFLGTPELMLMRNSGHFVRFLLDWGFRLVLHGHLHRHDCQQYQAIREGRNRLLEVIACGASSRPSEAEPCAFNIIRIHRDGFVEGQAYRLSPGGLLTGPENLATALYEAVRISHYDTRAPLPGPGPKNLPPDQPLRCRKHTLFWDLLLPAGDVVSHEHIEGLSCVGPDSVPELRLYASGDQLSVVGFEVECPENPGRASPDVQIERTGSGTDVLVWYRVLFTPPLQPGEQLNLRLSRHFWGAFFSSQQALHWWDPDSRVEPDRLLHRVRWPCEQLLLRLRFSSAAWNTVRIHHEVFRMEVEGNEVRQGPAERERQAPHVMVAESAASDPGAAPEALLAVYRPRLGYYHALSWQAPPEGPMSDEDRSSLVRLCRQLLEPPQSDRGPARAAVSDFLTRARQAADPSPAAAAGLFAFNRRNGQLECVAKEGSDQLHFPTVRWGRDIIGTAFRRHAPVSYVRGDRVAQIGEAGATHAVVGAVLRQLPDKVQVLLAYPLYAPRPANWPVAVLALATTDAGSVLGPLVRDERQVRELNTRLFELWREHFQAIFAIHPRERST